MGKAERLYLFTVVGSAVSAQYDSSILMWQARIGWGCFGASESLEARPAAPVVVTWSADARQDGRDRGCSLWSNCWSRGLRDGVAHSSAYFVSVLRCFD